MDQAAVDRPAGMKRLLQRVEDKARRSGAAGPPAHDPSGILAWFDGEIARVEGRKRQ
jgi:hypothetical protein